MLSTVLSIIITIKIAITITIPRCFQVVVGLCSEWSDVAIATSLTASLLRMSKRCKIVDVTVLVGLDPELYSLFEGEKGAHGGDLGLPAGDGGGQGGQAPAGQVQGEQQ